MQSPPCSPISRASTPPSFFYEDEENSPPPPPPASSRPFNHPKTQFFTPPPPPPPISCRPANQPTISSSTIRRLSKAVDSNNSTFKRNLLYELSNQASAYSPPANGSTPTKRRVINDEDWENMVSRLYLQKERRDCKVMECAETIQAMEQVPCTFTPKLNERSLRMAAQFQDDFCTRSQDRAMRREAKLAEERAALAELQQRQLTFRPQVNPSNVKSRVSSDNPQQRKLEAARLAEQQRDQDFYETHTFSPTLNLRSLELTQNRPRQDLTPQKLLVSPAKHCNNNTHKPQINSHSRKLAAARNESVPAFERLYAQGVAARRARMELQE